LGLGLGFCLFTQRSGLEILRVRVKGFCFGVRVRVFDFNPKTETLNPNS